MVPVKLASLMTLMLPLWRLSQQTDLYVMEVCQAWQTDPKEITLRGFICSPSRRAYEERWPNLMQPVRRRLECEKYFFNETLNTLFSWSVVSPNPVTFNIQKLISFWYSCGGEALVLLSWVIFVECPPLCSLISHMMKANLMVSPLQMSGER